MTETQQVVDPWKQQLREEINPELFSAHFRAHAHFAMHGLLQEHEGSLQKTREHVQLGAMALSTLSLLGVDMASSRPAKLLGLVGIFGGMSMILSPRPRADFSEMSTQKARHLALARKWTVLNDDVMTQCSDVTHATGALGNGAFFKAKFASLETARRRAAMDELRTVPSHAAWEIARRQMKEEQWPILMQRMHASTFGVAFTPDMTCTLQIQKK